MSLNYRVVIAIATSLMVITLGVLMYAFHGYMESECFSQAHKTGLDRQVTVIFDDAREIVADLQKGSNKVEKWDNKAFQEELKNTLHILSAARKAMKKREAFTVIDSVTDLAQSLSKAKGMAVDRVNEILATRTPSGAVEFEKNRLEGKNLVEVVRQIDSVLEAIDNLPRKLPEKCS